MLTTEARLGRVVTTRLPRHRRCERAQAGMVLTLPLPLLRVLRSPRMEVRMPVTGSVPVPSKWNKYRVSTENADTSWGSLAKDVLC